MSERSEMLQDGGTITFPLRWGLEPKGGVCLPAITRLVARPKPDAVLLTGRDLMGYVLISGVGAIGGLWLSPTHPVRGVQQLHPSGLPLWVLGLS